MKALSRCLSGIALLACFNAMAHAAPLDLGFTYQGSLSKAGAPVQGQASFRFSLWDASTGGAQLGVTQVAQNVPVSSGTFTVTLNSTGQFGVDAFNGDKRWLQVEVCADSTCSSATLLDPRQPVTGTPYALQAVEAKYLFRPTGGVGIRIAPASVTNTAGMLSNTSISDLVLGSFLDAGVAHSFISTGYSSNSRKLSLGRASSADPATKVFEPLMTLVSNSGNVGIGTATPAFPLSFPASLGDKVALYSTPAGGPNYGLGVQSNLLQVHSDASGADIGFGFGSSASFTERVRIATATGNVGIGTTAPTAKLDVRGDIKMGSSGNEYAGSGTEPLRIVRGILGQCSETIHYGSGYSVENIGTCGPNYIRRIIFTTPFLAPPSVVATPADCSGCFTAFCEIVSVSATDARVAIYDRNAGAYTGQGFHFIAIGPR